MGLPAVEHTTCQGYARLGVQGKGAHLAIIVPCPQNACTQSEVVLKSTSSMKA